MVMGGADSDGNVLSDVEVISLQAGVEVPTCLANPRPLPDLGRFQAMGGVLSGSTYSI